MNGNGLKSASPDLNTNMHVFAAKLEKIEATLATIGENNKQYWHAPHDDAYQYNEPRQCRWSLQRSPGPYGPFKVSNPDPRTWTGHSGN